jgi:hypothetical protein
MSCIMSESATVANVFNGDRLQGNSIRDRRARNGPRGENPTERSERMESTMWRASKGWIEACIIRHVASI